MTAPTNHWKLGLFVVLGSGLLLATLVFLGGAAFTSDTATFVSFFDESVEGLDIGSPVKFRGVRVGTVSRISVAGDKRHVMVSFDLGVDSLGSLGVSRSRSGGPASVPPDLRVQLVPAGITGAKFLQMDFFTDQTLSQIEELPFRTPPNTIPVVPSTMKSLEATAVQMMERFPQMTQELLQLLQSINTIVGQLDANSLASKISAALVALTRVLEQVSRTLDAIDPDGLSRQLGGTLRATTEALGSLKVAADRITADDGLLESLERTSESLGTTVSNASQVGPSVEATLQDVQRAANAIERLAEDLQRDPDMLLKGRARRSAP